ncbi:MAG: hypothetical protein KatS3mg057_0713 [Herpetosiphonaceae bacterium]|nr:MAG: hypothetical protein KatS3mg057_0713 [Herpetosiphonaceae bacterium]
MTTSSRRRRARRPARRNLPHYAAVEPTPFDHTVEYRYIRYDLVRILLIGGGLIALMIVLYLARVF